MRKRILFVDDEPMILHALRRMLSPYRNEWTMTFASSGEEALKWLEQAPYNVIVSDMRMPGMDGATLLTHVQERFPQVVRIILSGYSDLEAALRAVPVTHQFLTKPCDSLIVKEVIERAMKLQELIVDDTIRQVIGKISQLPIVSSVHASLMASLDKPNVSLQEISSIIKQDIALSAKILQLVNSSFFGLPRRVSNLEDAVSFLSINMIKNLALSMEVFKDFKFPEINQMFPMKELQEHSISVGGLAKNFLDEKQASEEAFLAGMLHDIGHLVLATKLPEDFLKVLDEKKKEGLPFHEIEKRVLGVSHAEIGAYLLGVWGLPYSIIEAVAYHNLPSKGPQRAFDAIGAVHVANVLSQQRTASLKGLSPLEITALDQEYLKAVGKTDQIPAWQQVTKEFFEKQKEKKEG